MRNHGACCFIFMQGDRGQVQVNRGLAFAGLRVSVSGSGNVAQRAVEKALALGAKVITVSDSSGTIVDEDGCDAGRLAVLMDITNNHYGRVSDYAARTGARFESGRTPWHVPVAVALPCATQNELDAGDACCRSCRVSTPRARRTAGAPTAA